MVWLIFSSCTNGNAVQHNLAITEEQNYSGINVSTSKVRKENFKYQIISNGIVEARSRSELRFKTGEQIEKIYVENGEQVKKGELLANLNNKLLKSELEYARIAFSKAQGQLIAQKINFGVKDIPEKEINPSVLKTIYHNSGYQAAKNLLTTAQIRFNQTLLKMPFDGTVANLVVKEGNYINSSENFCIVLSNDKLDVIFYILESEISKVAIGQSLEFVPFSSKGLSFFGEIVEINPLVNENGLVRIKGNIKNPSGDIFDGMNIKVFIHTEYPDVLVIPKEAIVHRSDRTVVFTYEKGFAKWNYVEITAENTNYYAVSNGLKPEDTIIISGNLNLTQKAQVNPTFIGRKE